MIEIFDNRVEISNPGGIPSELSEGDFGKKSVTRNSVIASLLHRIDYIEKIGTGINRIKDAIEEHGKSTVEFKLTGFFTVIFKRKEDPTQKTTQKLNRNQIEILNYLSLHPTANREEIASNLENITEDGVKYNLKKLQSLGLLKRIGPDNGGHWEVVD